MAINSKRASDINAYINNHDCIRGKQKVEIGGKIDVRDSYMIPISLLLYNHDNRRFNIEIQEYEEKIERELEPTDKDDAEIIKKLLLYEDVNSDNLNNEAKKLVNDLELVGEQREVAHITNDGIVVNGNRRMAALELLHSKQPTGKWQELWVVRLPADISEPDLWKIEAGLQLSKERVADYGPVNNLLMIKEGASAGLSASEIAAAMYGWTEKQVIADLERLNLIELFLQFFGQPKNFGLIKRFRLHEHFIDIQKYLLAQLQKSGVPKRKIPKLLEPTFVYISSHIENADSFNITHMDVRNICKFLVDEKASYALTETFNNYKNKKDIPVDTLKDNFDKATDIIKYKDDKGKPYKLIDRAVTALNGVDSNNEHFMSDSRINKRIISN